MSTLGLVDNPPGETIPLPQQPTGEVIRRRVAVTGLVQGVGFRPFVHGLATGLGLTGNVVNDSDGVLIEVEGAASKVHAFLVRLRESAPPLAVIDEITVTENIPDAEEAILSSIRRWRLRPQPTRICTLSRLVYDISGPPR